MPQDLDARPEFLPHDLGTVGHQGFVEIVAPPRVSFVPRTPAWYVLGALLCCALIALGWRGLKRYRKNVYRRAALQELKVLVQAVQKDRAAMAQAPLLLKRCALAAFPREQVAPLSGKTWLAFLERSAPGALDGQAGDCLVALAAGNSSATNLQQETLLLKGIGLWIRRHRV